MISTENINAVWGSLIVEELIRQGVDYFCVSPGSRSTPLTVAVARNARAKSIVCYDERGAAFHALGYGRATGKPAVLICTSGTAAANYLPAVIEADVDHVPMIVLSADRPPELRETMANQTIVQAGMFGRYTRWFFDMPAPTASVEPQFVLTTIAHAVNRAVSPAGAVHLNCQFREPLAPIVEAVPDGYLDGLAGYFGSRNPYTSYSVIRSLPDEETTKRLIEIVEGTERGILAVGQLKSAVERQVVGQLIEALDWTVFPDITSGLRLGSNHRAIVHYFDQILLSTSPDLYPQSIIHIGGQLVSKRLLQFCQRVRPENYVVIKPTPERHDPFHGVTLRISADLPTYLSTLIPVFHSVIHNGDAWWKIWDNRNRVVGEVVSNQLSLRQAQDTAVNNESWVARVISAEIPANHALFIGNSMPIRDMDMFAVPDGNNVPVAANRGASGIDGNLATGMGYAVGLQRPTTVLVGDLTFLHDLNSLSLLRYVDQPMTIVVINNGGGGIFHKLPIAQFDEVFEPFFGTPHSFSFGQIAAAFGIDYWGGDSAEFQPRYQHALQSNRHTILEIKTDRHENQRTSLALTASIRACLE